MLVSVISTVALETIVGRARKGKLLLPNHDSFCHEHCCFREKGETPVASSYYEICLFLLEHCCFRDRKSWGGGGSLVTSGPYAIANDFLQDCQLIFLPMNVQDTNSACDTVGHILEPSLCFLPICLYLVSWLRFHLASLKGW